MPFLAKVASRLRGTPKEENGRGGSGTRAYPAQQDSEGDLGRGDGRRNKVSRKGSRAGDGRHHRGWDDDYDRGEDFDVDLLYRRSKEGFGSWDIKDITLEDKNAEERRKSGTRVGRKSRFDAFEGSDRIDKEDRAKDKSTADNCCDVRGRDNERSSQSRRKNSFSFGSPSRGREAKLPKDLREEIENFSSSGGRERNATRSPTPQRSSIAERRGRRYDVDCRSPDRENDRIRALIERFKSRDDEIDEEEGSGRRRPLSRGQSHSPSGKPSRDSAGTNDRERRTDEGAENHELDPPRQGRRLTASEGRLRDEADPRERWRPGRSDSSTAYHRSLDRKSSDRRREDVAVDEGGSLTRRRHDSSRRGKPREFDEDGYESKRRSRTCEGSPESYFDVRIQRYERTLPLRGESPDKRDPESNGKSSYGSLDSSYRRRDDRESLEASRNVNSHRGYDKENEGFDSRGNDRARTSRSLAGRPKFPTRQQDERQRHGRVRNGSTSPRRNFAEVDTEERREIYFGDSNCRVDDAAPRRVDRSATKRNFTADRVGANTTVIEIRSDPREDRARATNNEKKWRRGRFADTRIDDQVHRGRRGIDDDDDDDDDGYRDRGRCGRSARDGVTPSRKIWNYRDGGVKITDVEEGQSCLQCGYSCPGFSPHSWRKNCTSCKCPKEAHDVCHEEWVSVRARLGLKGDETSGPMGFDPRDRGLAWAPPGLPPHKVEEYFSMLPEISVPRLGTPGERQRDRQLATQLPKQDLAKAYCRHLDPQHSTSADDFMAARNEIALDIGSVQEILEGGLECSECHKPLKYGTLAVSASKLGFFYHPACFQCAQCKELLVDLAYCVHDDTLYCERHYAEQLKPRCAACDELIFSGEYTKAMNKDWHSGHFCCWQCDESLTGQRYVLRDEHPYCIKCYESVFANACEECNKIIGIDSKDLSYKDKHWHEACFICNKCRTSLVDKQFGSKLDKIYCGNCYDAQFASRCDGCGEIFRAGTKKMEYKTRQWHEKCFCCVVCKNPIGTKSFIPREQEIYCGTCYEDKFATRCVKCNKIITSGGVTYKNEPWHRDCFTCSNCNNSLAGQRFTSRDDKPYCADCFGELFAKRCTACSKPITGIGGTRFISFEDRHWHNDCFICAGCKTSLVGHGFITDGDDIICPECAKQKLM